MPCFADGFDVFSFHFLFHHSRLAARDAAATGERTRLLRFIRVLPVEEQVGQGWCEGVGKGLPSASGSSWVSARFW